jgi:glutamyl-tRNA synthetase
MSDEKLYESVLPFVTNEVSGITLNAHGELAAEGKTGAEVKDALMRLMPLIKERLHFLEEAAEMVSFLFKEPASPKAEDLIPKKMDAAKTKEVLAAALEFVKKADGLSHDDADNLARSTAEALGIKLGDFMMPIRIALTGSKISPPLIGSIAILGTDKAIKRIERALNVF